MKKELLKIVGLSLGIFSVLPVHAQNIIPWVGKSLSKEVVSSTLAATAPKAFLGAGSTSLLKVMPQARIVSGSKLYNFTEAPQALSEAEKALWVMPKSQGAQLGLAAVLYDQNAILYKAIQAQGENQILQAEFEAHQQALAAAVNKMQQQLTFNTSFTLGQIYPHGFDGWEKILKKVDNGMTEQTVQLLFDGEPQPLFVVMTKGEMQTFAALPSLEHQRAYIEDSIAVAEEQLGRIASQDVTALSARSSLTYSRSQERVIGQDAYSEDALTTYYLQKVRLDYFKQMQKLLANATEKRQSLIMRYRIPPEDGMPAMTDAQRYGYVLFKRDKALERVVKTSADKNVLRENLAEVVRFQEEASFRAGEVRYMEKYYGPYARAEVFGIPYEESFHIGEGSLLLFDEGKALLELPQDKQLYYLLEGRLKETENALQQMLRLTPTGEAFYAEYYKLSAMKKVYQGQMNTLVYLK